MLLLSLALDWTLDKIEHKKQQLAHTNRHLFKYLQASHSMHVYMVSHMWTKMWGKSYVYNRGRPIQQ